MYTLEFKRPTLEDRCIIEDKLKTYTSRSCERTFVNVFLWARYYQVEYAIIENCLVFKSEHEKLSFTYPSGKKEDVQKAIIKLEQYVMERDTKLSFYNVTPEQFEVLEELYPNKYNIVYNRDIADYVYETEKLTTLAGKKLHAKRNHINKFKATYEHWSYESLSSENIEECFQMAMKWRTLNDCQDDVDKVNEMAVTMNALRLFDELELKGGILRVDKEIVAFTLGEAINEDTFVVHIEKAFTDILGAYPMINQQFVTHECQEFTYINREEDTGSEGLRKAKLSYRPIFLIEKGYVTIKD